MHFAALKAVGESGRKPLEYYENNVGGALGTAHSAVLSSNLELAVALCQTAPIMLVTNAWRKPVGLFRCMHDFGCKRIVFSSSATVYGQVGPGWRRLASLLRAAMTHRCVLRAWATIPSMRLMRLSDHSISRGLPVPARHHLLTFLTGSETPCNCGAAVWWSAVRGCGVVGRLQGATY